MELADLKVFSVGDMNVPVSTGVAYARAAGIIDFESADPTYDILDDDDTPGISDNGLFLQLKVAEAVSRFDRFTNTPFVDNRQC